MTEQLEELLRLSRTLAAESPCDHLRLVAVSMDGEIRMLPVSDDPQYRIELYKVLTDNLTPLGLLGFEDSDGKIQAQSFLFPWHEDVPNLADLFERVCDQAVENVQRGFERRGRVN